MISVNNKKEEEFIRLIKTQLKIDYYLDYWDPKHFPYYKYYLLIEFCHDYFDIWWDKDKCDYLNYTWYLIRYYSEYFHIWWDPNKVKLQFCINAIIEYCSEYINVWYDYIWDYIEKEAMDYAIKLLFKHCDKYMNNQIKNDLTLRMI